MLDAGANTKRASIEFDREEEMSVTGLGNNLVFRNESSEGEELKPTTVFPFFQKCPSC